MITAGIYQIKCASNNKTYIGSSVNIRKRWKHHKFQLRRGTHVSKYMQNSWNKHGEASFEFSTLVKCDKDNVLFYEQRFLDAMNPPFNTAKVAGSALGQKRSEEVLVVMREAQRKNTRKYLWRGKEMCLAEIAEIEGVNYRTLTNRVMVLKMDVADAVNKPIRNNKQIHMLNGKPFTTMQISAELGMHPRRFAYWIAQGLSVGEIVSRLNITKKSISFREFCKIAGANMTTAKSRIKAGFSLMESISQGKEVRHG